MEFQHLLKRKLSTDITVHNDKGVWTPSSDLVAEMVETSGCAKWRVFLQVSNRHLKPQDVFSQVLLFQGRSDLLVFCVHVCNK